MITAGSFVKCSDHTTPCYGHVLKVHKVCSTRESMTLYKRSEPVCIVIKGYNAGYAAYVVSTRKLFLVDAPDKF